jgi:plastocyanin
MDKVGSVRNKILFLLGIFILALAFSAAMPNANAGTAFAQPEPAEKLAPGESYPESRFGHPPMKVETGVSRGYASRAVDDMEQSDEADQPVIRHSAGGARSPAGLEFVSNKRSGDAQLAPGTAPRMQESAGQLNTGKAAARLGVQEVALIASDLGYFPKTVFVSRDVPVRMFVTGSSKNTLCIMMDSFSVRKQVRSQKIEEITFTPNIPGKYRFYCPVNGMEGTMVVKEFASQTSFSEYSSSNSGLAASEDSVSAHAAAPSRRRPSSDESVPKAAPSDSKDVTSAIQNDE